MCVSVFVGGWVCVCNCACVCVSVGQIIVTNDGKVEMFVPAYNKDKMYVYRFENTQREEDVIG